MREVARGRWAPPVPVLIVGQPVTGTTTIALPAADRNRLVGARLVVVTEGDTVTGWVTGPQAPSQASAASHSATLAQGDDGTISPPGALAAFTSADVERRSDGR